MIYGWPKHLMLLLGNCVLWVELRHGPVGIVVQWPAKGIARTRRSSKWNTLRLATVVCQQATWTMDGTRKTRCDRLMKRDSSCVILVLRHRLVVLFSSLPFALLDCSALCHLFLLLLLLKCLLAHDVLLAMMLLFDFSFALLAVRTGGWLWWLVVHRGRTIPWK